MERTPIDSYDAQHSPRHQRDREPIAHRCWRATACFHLLCHKLAISFLTSKAMSIALNTAGIENPQSVFGGPCDITQAAFSSGIFHFTGQVPALTSAAIRSATVECPVFATSP